MFGVMVSVHGCLAALLLGPCQSFMVERHDRGNSLSSWWVGSRERGGRIDRQTDRQIEEEEDREHLGNR